MTKLNHEMIEALRNDTARLVEQLAMKKQKREQAGYAALTQDEFEWYTGHIAHASDMMIIEPREEMTLLEPILPRSGVVALVGSSDSGKSTLLRGLAMAIVRGDEEYIGFKLNARYHHAMYISTEDDQQSLGSLMRRQTLSPSRDEALRYDNLHFIFDTDNLLETVELGLKSYTPDVVIVDAFADLYTGPMNENNRVRSFIQAFSQLAARYDTLFIFLHHTGKRTESLAPSKHNAIGSQGFEAKMRLMMELRPDPERHDIRHLCIVKGNYLPAEYKHDSFELRFTDTLNFEATGARVPFAALRERTEEQEDLAAKAQIALAMKAEGKNYDEIAEALGYKSRSSVCELLKRFSE